MDEKQYTLGDLSSLVEQLHHLRLKYAWILIDHGANVNAKAKGDVTPLHIAAQKGNMDLVKILLSHKADAQALDDKGRSPRDRALQWGHPEVARFLDAQ